MSTTAERVRELVEPLLVELDVSIYDVEHAGGVLRILLQRADGLDLSVLTRATRLISAALDEADPVPAKYTLEVSSPGLERPLRTPEHFAGAIGDQVKVKTRAGVEGDRRVDGELVAAEGDTITVRTPQGERQLALSDIDRAHTHVEWKPPPKPGAPGSGTTSKKQKPKQKRQVSDAERASEPSPPTGSSTPQSEASS